MQQSRSRPSSRRPSSACPPPRRCRVSLVVPVHARVALGEGGTTLCPCPVPSMPACCCRCSRSSDLRASASSCRCTLASHFNPSSAAESTRSPPAPVAAAQSPLCCYLIHGRRCRIGQCALPPRDPSRAGARTRRTPTLAVLEIPHRSPLHQKVQCAAPTLKFLGDQVTPLDSSATDGTCVVCARFYLHWYPPSHSDAQFCRVDFLAARPAAAAGEAAGAQVTVFVSDLCQIVRPARVRGCRLGVHFMSRAGQCPVRTPP